MLYIDYEKGSDQLHNGARLKRMLSCCKPPLSAHCCKVTVCAAADGTKGSRSLYYTIPPPPPPLRSAAVIIMLFEDPSVNLATTHEESILCVPPLLSVCVCVEKVVSLLKTIFLFSLTNYNL